MPDDLVSSSKFIQSVDQGHDTQLSVTSGCTVVFDSYSPEPEVRRRNLKNNNVSKLNHMPNRFPTDFNVRVRADSVAAILCAETVSDYKVVDKKSGQTITATDKRPNYMKAPYKVSAKRKHSEPSLETKALNGCEDSEQTYYFSSSPCMTAPHPRALTTGNEEKARQAHQYYHVPCTTAPHPCVFGHPGFPRCLLGPPVYSRSVHGYHDSFKHLVEAADKSYKETVGIMTDSTSSSLSSSTGLDEHGAGDRSSSFTSNGLLTKQQPEPIFNANMHHPYLPMICRPSDAFGHP